ncbi:hypothetical protein [Streptomyces canus]|uniref:hypothetical protein n=1 Tax=Streptomyces canus TaxID=58343 RepID=UPI002DDAE935|nr:hypothetical protein [Streptomyces canus]WSD83736.1 hypothetical protein OG925_05260 [Streptomyces canus]
MNVHKRAITVVFLVATALGSFGAPAMAAPMPWETSKVPAVPAGADGQDGAVTVRCAPPCYQ